MRPALVRRALVTGARAEYLLNASELRGLTRYNADRDNALRVVCDARQHWFGDRWSRPVSSEGAKAALMVMTARRYGGDPLQTFARLQQQIPNHQRAALLRLRAAVRYQWTRGPAPLPDAKS